MSSKEFKPQIYYLIRRGLNDQLLKYCDSLIAKKGKDPIIVFWKAYALGMTNNIPECIRQLENFQARKDMQYPVTMALLFFHQKATVVDQESVESLSGELNAAELVTKDAGLALGARFALFTGDLENSLRLVSKFLPSDGITSSSTPMEIDAVSIDFWILVMRAMKGTASDRRSLNEIDKFMRGRAAEQVDIDLLMVWIKAQQVTRSIPDALNNLNQIIAIHPWYTPALVEKSVLLASMSEWDQALDTAQRVLDVEPENLDALKVLAVHAFTQESQPHDALQKLEDLDATFRLREPNSAPLAFEYASIFSRVCSRHPRALQICANFIEVAQELSPADPLYIRERAHIYVLQGQYSNAIKMYRDASKKDAQSFLSLEGMILCQIYLGHLDDAEGQLELLYAMHNSEDDNSPQLKYIQALLALRTGRNLTNHEKFLNEARVLFFQIYEKAVLNWVPPLHEIVVLNPDFLLQIAVSYLAHLESPIPASLTAGKTTSAIGGSSGLDKGGVTNVEDRNITSRDDVPNAIQHAMELLTMIQSKFPGLLTPYIELCRCNISLGKCEEAIRSLRQVLQLQPTCIAALVMTAKVEISRGNTVAADRALEQALSFDFSIRSVPLFRLVQISVRAQQGKNDEALTEAESLIGLPEVRHPGPEEGPGRMHTDYLRMTDDDRVTVFVTLASQLGKARRLKEANRIISEAKIAFAGTPQEVQVLLASSQLAVERNDFDTAVRMLDKIAEDSPTFARAQMIKAEILLNHSRDKEAFTLCYHRLVELDPSPKSYSLLGEAYLRILNPEAAVSAFEEASKMDKTNSKLRARIGKALVATHEYHRAIDFYEQSLRDATSSVTIGSNMSDEVVTLFHDLGKLYLKLGRVESARRVLEKAIHRSQKDITEIKQDVQTLLLLADVQAIHAPADVIGTLKRAREFQKEVVNQSRATMAQGSDTLEKERKMLSTICEKLGGWFLEKKEERKDFGPYNEASNFLNEALQHDPQNIRAMYALAQTHYRRNEIESCQMQCKKILTADPSDEDAAIMLSDCLYRENDADGAVRPLQNLLTDHPNNYHAMEKMVLLYRRIGKLHEVPAFIAAAEQADRRSGAHPGLKFCKGLYARYTNDISLAIREFNLARRDSVWGYDALVHMIELYLNPDQEGAWEEREREEGPMDDVTEHIAIADALIKELKTKPARDPKRLRVLENYHLLATRNKAYSDRAMQSFIEMLEEEPDYLPAVLGMATGFMLEKNQHKARNLLKRVQNIELSKSDGEDYEKANLLLAKFFVDKAKNDAAQELCKKCLAQNKSCSQAWEILGLAMERDVDYEHASECYEKAWKLEFEASASVGFKLAFSLLKCKKNVKAIDVCEQVLSLYPDYPRIREEILKKAQQALRP